MEWALGHFYLENTSDHQKAYYWLKKAADAGQMNAKIELGANFSSSGATPFSTASQSGVAAGAGMARTFVAKALPDAQLAMVSTSVSSPTEYVFFSPSKHMHLVVLDVHGVYQVSALSLGALDLPLPPRFVDLPAAILAARRQGLRGDVKSAVLIASGPKGKAAIAAWTITPATQTTRALSYFVSATDGRALGLMDISDGIGGNDEQLRELYRREHPPTEIASSQGGGSTTSNVRRSIFPSPSQQYVMNQLHTPGNTCPGGSGCR